MLRVFFVLAVVMAVSLPGVAESTTAPLRISGYEWSTDNRQMLIFTNTKKVWRLNTRGDYWVLDIASGKLTKIGGDAKPSTLMFAKFSPDGTRVGYVMENNLYVQNLTDGKITPLTREGSLHPSSWDGAWAAPFACADGSLAGSA